MKRNAIIRIIIYSIIIVMLASALFIGLAGSIYSFSHHTGDFTEGSTSVDADNVRSIHIEWAAGTITLVPGDTQEIIVTESGSDIGEYTMVTDCRNGELTIRYSEKTVTIGIGTPSIPNKDLTVTVPQDWICESLSIEAASTDIRIENQTIDTFSLDSASGDCELESCNIRKMDIDAASCDLTFTGTIEHLDCDGASASLTLICDNVPDAIDLDGASAELDLTLPADCGFRVEMDGLSSSFGSDFAHHTSDGCHSYGDGHCRIDVDGVSAGVYIHCADHHEDDHHH